jgi:hypothetical protein
MDFEVIGDITGTETIATVLAFANLAVYASAMVRLVGASVRVSQKFASLPAKLYGPSYAGIGKREMKVKAFI